MCKVQISSINCSSVSVILTHTHTNAHIYICVDSFLCKHYNFTKHRASQIQRLLENIENLANLKDYNPPGGIRKFIFAMLYMLPFLTASYFVWTSCAKEYKVISTIVFLFFFWFLFFFFCKKRSKNK